MTIGIAPKCFPYQEASCLPKIYSSWIGVPFFKIHVSWSSSSSWLSFLFFISLPNESDGTNKSQAYFGLVLCKPQHIVLPVQFTCALQPLYCERLPILSSCMLVLWCGQTAASIEEFPKIHFHLWPMTGLYFGMCRGLTISHQFSPFSKISPGIQTDNTVRFVTHFHLTNILQGIEQLYHYQDLQLSPKVIK